MGSSWSKQQLPPNTHCDDCLSGIHRRRCRRRGCVCEQCGRRVTKPETPAPKSPPPARKHKPNRTGSRSVGVIEAVPTTAKASKPGPTGAPKHDPRHLRGINDDVCREAVAYIAAHPDKTFTQVAYDLRVSRTNLAHALRRRGLR